MVKTIYNKHTFYESWWINGGNLTSAQQIKLYKIIFEWGWSQGSCLLKDEKEPCEVLNLKNVGREKLGCEDAEVN